MKASDSERGKPLTVEPVGVLADFVNGLLRKMKLAYSEKLGIMAGVPEEKIHAVKRMSKQLSELRKKREDKMEAEQRRIAEERLAEQRRLVEEKLREQIALQEKAKAEELAVAQKIEAEKLAAEEKAAEEKRREEEKAAEERRKALEKAERFKKNPPRVLVAFFSRADENYKVGFVETGNTELMAKYIMGRLRKIYGVEQIDEFKIVPLHQYPIKYMSTVELATSEKRTNQRPIIIDEIDDLADYDVVLIGYPIWWGDLPMIMRSFFDEYDFSGKILVPFCTHEGSGDAGTFGIMKELERGATVLDGKAVVGHVARTNEAHDEIDEWIEATAEKILEMRG